MSIRKHGAATGEVTEVEDQGFTKTAQLDGQLPLWDEGDEADLMAETDGD
jgi:hypothetical protein